MSVMSNDEGKCQVCQKLCNQKCSRCKLVYYCSIEHQKEHWKVHKYDCTNYEICSNKTLGRYIVAKRDLEPGEVIFVDKPIVFGPRPYTIEEGPFPCVGCSRILHEEIHSCPECGWPACSPECMGLKNPEIHGLECQILKLRPRKENESNYAYYRFDTLIILRSLFLQKINKRNWDLLLQLEDHLDNRGPNSVVYKSIQEKVHYILENFIKPLRLHEQEIGHFILPRVSGDIIHKIYGVFDVNAVEITEPVDLFILYPTVSLVEHNCVPNISQTIDEKNGYKLTFRAALPIKKGNNICNTYTNILWGTQERRKHLKENKYFSCFCRRCQDPIELNTYFSALICLGTEEESCKGIQLPVNPIVENPEWKCNKCGIKLPNKEISEFISHLRIEVEKEIAKKPGVHELEEFCNKLSVFLHPNHYLMYAVKHSLVQLYQTEGEIEISNNFLKDKLKMCEELISLTKKIDPGTGRLSLYLAVLLNEQYMAKFKQLKRSFSAEAKETSRELIKEIVAILSECKKILEFEQHMETGFKLMQVISLNDITFKNWLDENSVSVD